MGAYLLKLAGFNLEKAQNLLYVMNKMPKDKTIGQGAQTKAALLSTHPPSSERFIAWRKAMDEINVNETKLPYPKSNQ